MRIELRTSQRQEFVDITSRVAEAIERAAAGDGAALVFCPHTTAGVTINENADPDVTSDLGTWLDGVAPRTGRWRHSEGNSDGHAKSTLVGPSLLVPVEAGRLALGTWQAIYFCEFDGPRTRQVSVTFVG